MNANYKKNFDNYYTAVLLIAELYKRGILSLGTVRKNRLPNCKLPDDKFWKNKDRGCSYELVANVDGMDIVVVAW